MWTLLYHVFFCTCFSPSNLFSKLVFIKKKNTYCRPSVHPFQAWKAPTLLPGSKQDAIPYQAIPYRAARGVPVDPAIFLHDFCIPYVDHMLSRNGVFVTCRNVVFNDLPVLRHFFASVRSVMLTVFYLRVVFYAWAQKLHERKLNSFISVLRFASIIQGTLYHPSGP